MLRPHLSMRLLVSVILAGVAAGTLSADYRPTSRLAWAFDGTIDESERAGNILYLAGDFTGAAPIGNLAPRLVELQTSGSATPARTLPSPSGPVNVIIPDGAGGYFVGGGFTSIGGSAQAALAHVRPDGTVDPAFAPVITPVGTSQATVRALALSGTTLYVGGHFSQVNAADRWGGAAIDVTTGAVLAWDLGLPPGSEVSALAVSGTTVYLGASDLLAVDATSGTPLPGFTATVNGGISALVASGSSVYLGGTFTTVNGASRLGLAAVDATTGTVLPLTADVNAGGWVAALALDGTALYVGGQFNSLGGQARGRLGAVDVSTGAVTAFNPGANGTAFALLAQGGTVYVGGLFSRVGGEARANIARLSSSGGVLPWNPGLSSRVVTLASSGGVVAAGGSFTHFGAVARDGLAAVDLLSGELTSLAPAIVSGTFGSPLIGGLDVAGNTLYLGGRFTSVDGVARTNLAALDVRTGTVLPWDPEADGYVDSIEAVGGTTYVAGQFANVAGVARNSLAALDATTGADLGWDAGVTGQVYELEVADTTLYAAGGFSQLGGQARSNVGAFDLATWALTSFDPSVAGTSAYVTGLRATATHLFVSGNFTSVGGQARTSAAAVDRATGAPAPFAPVVADPAFDIDVIDGVVYLVGDLGTVNGAARAGIAAVDAATGLVNLPFDPGFGTTAVQSYHVRAEPDLLIVGAWGTDSAKPSVFPTAPMGGAPGRPSVPVPAVTGGSAIAMHWRPSLIGGEPTSYVVEAGTTPGAVNVGTLPTSGPSFSFAGVPPGRYFLRVRALNAFGSSPASPEIAVVFGNVSCGAVPLPVTAGATVSGSTVTVTWPDAVGAHGTYTLVAGTGPGLSNIATLGTGATRQLVTNAPAGVYYARVMADSACGQGAPGPDTVVAVGGALPLPSPSIGAQLTGSTVTVTWAPVPGAAGYQLEAGTGPLLANIVTTTTAATSLVANGVPSGTYYVRVRALASGGTSVSNELVVMVP